MDNFVFEEPLDMSWSRLDFATANHEAAHAVMAAILGIEVYEVRIDSPIDPRDRLESLRGPTLGWTRRARADDARKSILVSIAPLVIEGRVPEELPSLNTDDGDEFSAAVAAFDAAGWTQETWKETVEIARGLLGMPSAKSALRALSGELLDRGAVPGDEVRRLVCVRPGDDYAPPGDRLARGDS